MLSGTLRKIQNNNYASLTWTPYTQKDVKGLEQVQKMLKDLSRDYWRSTSISALIKSFGWDTLEHS